VAVRICGLSYDYDGCGNDGNDHDNDEDDENHRYQKVGGDRNVDLEKNGKNKLDRKKDKRGNTKYCRGRQKLVNTI